MRRIGEHLANPDLNTINNSNLERWPEVWAGRQTSNNFVFDRKMVGLWPNCILQRDSNFLFVIKMGASRSWDNKGAKKKKLIFNFFGVCVWGLLPIVPWQFQHF